VVRTSGRRAAHRSASLRERVAPWLAMLIALSIAVSTAVRRHLLPHLRAAARRSAVAGMAADRAGLRALDRAGDWSWAAAVAMAHTAATASRVLLCRILPQLARRFGRPLARLALWAVLLIGLVAYATGPTLQLASTFVGDDVTTAEALPPLQQRSTVVAANGAQLAVLHRGFNRRVVAIDRVPDHVIQAVISAEDRRFYDHDGYDAEAIGRAALANLQAGAVTQGGSTITQQVAKGTFTDGDRTFARKWNELVHAVALERRLTKDEILERYLNQVYFGSGAYGIAAAAEEFFGVSVRRLTVDQAALLAGVIRSPSSMNPRAQPDAAVRRRNAVLAAMAEEGYLTPTQASKHAGAKLRLSKRRSPAQRPPTQPHVVEAVKREFLALPELGATRRQRTRLLYAGGVQITTSVRPRWQRAAAEAVRRYTDGIVPDGALAAVDPRNGRVLALHSGAGADSAQFDLATQGRRQPGSAFKPIVAAAALSAGLSPDQPLHGDSPITLDLPGSSTPWRVGNYESGDHGSVTLAEAMAASVNTAFAQVAAAVGTDAIARTAGRMGIDVPRALGPKATRGPAVALGGVTNGVTPLEMASAYGVFATAGDHPPPHLITEVRAADGTVLYAGPETPRRALAEGVTAHVRGMLRDVVRDGTGTAARLRSWDAIGKTGTTQNHADAWFVGTTPTVSTAVWVGHPDAQRPVPGLTGGSYPALIWRAFNEAVLDPDDAKAFPRLRRDLPDSGGLRLPPVRSG